MPTNRNIVDLIREQIRQRLWWWWISAKIWFEDSMRAANQKNTEKDFWEELTSALVVLSTASEERKLSFHKALVNEDREGAAVVLAQEIWAEKRIKQLMEKYADMADTWLWRGTQDGRLDQEAVCRAQMFFELELHCQHVLAKSKTESLRCDVANYLAKFGANETQRRLSAATH